MNKKLRVKSPTGIIHHVISCHQDLYTTLCNDSGLIPKWVETEQPVTCKHCLRQELLNGAGNNKCDVHICHSHIDPKKDIISVSNFPKSNLLKTLISQGYVTEPLEKDEQITILIYEQGINFCK